MSFNFCKIHSLDIAVSGFEARPLAEFLSKFTPIPIPYKDPIDWAKFVTIAIGVLGSLLFLRFIAPIVQNRWSWAAATVVTILVMVGGYMFTRIRGVPYNGGNGNWIAGGYQNQFGQEVQVVAFICTLILSIQPCPSSLTAGPADGLLSFALLMLILVVPHQTSPQRQRLQVYLWTGVTMIVYSVLVSLFRVKNRGVFFMFNRVLAEYSSSNAI